MPEIKRDPHRADCLGLDLVHPVDKMPPGAWPYLLNARVVQEGRLDARTGYVGYGSTFSMQKLYHSIRRLNDAVQLYAPTGYTNIAGNGTLLEAGTGGTAQIDTGYSGLPLSLLTFRPQNSPVAWMYVYDRNKLCKVRPDGLVRNIGVAPPTRGPGVEYGPPSIAPISSTVWTATGTMPPTVTVGDRTGGTNPTVGAILYNSGTTGWCCINPSCATDLGSSFFWSGERMRIILNAVETVVVREIHAPISGTTVQSIQYDSGTTGACSMVLVGSPFGLARNSLITVDSEKIRVLSVTLSPDGITYSLRCVTSTAHSAGATVTGLLSWYCYTTVNHVVGQSITAPDIMVGLIASTGSVNATGTSVTWVSGAAFDTAWPAGTLITLGAGFSSPKTYVIAGVVDSSHLTLTTSVGTSLTGTTYSVSLSSLIGGLQSLEGSSGVVSAVGSAVTWVSGNTFPASPAGTTIYITGKAYTIAAVHSSTSLSLTTSAGTLPSSWSGVVNTVGTTVNWVSGDHFAYSMSGIIAAGTSIVINGSSYIIASVNSSTSITLETWIGTQTGVSYSIVNSYNIMNSFDASTTTDGRPIDPANDYMHISVFLSQPQNVKSLVLAIDVDAQTSSLSVVDTYIPGNAFTGNYWTWTIPSSSFNSDIAGLDATSGTWFEILVPISSGVRSGEDLTRAFGNIMALQVQIVTTGLCDYGFNSWYFFGTYGPTVVPNSPTGLLYQTVNRDSTTGAQSVPGPAQRAEIFPLREEVIITPATSTETGVDSLDVYRQGGTLTGFVYVGTVVNKPSAPSSFNDVQADAVISANPAPDLTQIQPWPILRPPITGVANTAGTGVILTTGTVPLTLLANTIVSINGTDYQTYGQPRSSTFLEIISSAGTQASVPFEISSPTLAAQPLPYVFGPLEGPFSPVAFGLGDIYNAGTLYYSNSADLDGASDQNTIELCAPGEPLISGDVWNGICVVGSHDNIFIVKYSYLTTIGVSSGGPVTYQYLRVPSDSGMWSRWTCVRGKDGVYFLGRDGIYRATDQGTENTTDAMLYPMFPHDGHPAKAANGVQPVDMTNLTGMRLTRGDECIKFYYRDVNQVSNCLRYEYSKKRWFLENFADPIVTDYLVEENETSPVQTQVLQLSAALGYIYLAGGDTDNGTDIQTVVRFPSFDAGDERGQKLYVDTVHDFDQAGAVSLVFGFNNNTAVLPAVSLTSQATRQQYIKNISSLQALSLYRNITCQYSWTGGPDGPRLYAFEPSFYVQPYLSTKIVTQFIALGFPGWKHHRRLYACLISNSNVTFTVQTQDGRTYATVLPSTAGQLRVLPIMLPHGLKDLAFAYQLDGGATAFALFPDEFCIETKTWTQPDYVLLPVFRT